MKIEKQLQQIQKKLREIALDLNSANHVGEIGYNVERINEQADKLDGPITNVSGSGTGNS